MDVVKLAKWKKDLITKAWGKCNKSIRSISSLSKNKSSSSYSSNTTTRSPSFKHYLKKSFTISSTTTTSLSSSNINIDDQNPNKKKKNKKKKGASQVAPDGCFSVYVGPERRRFVVRAEFANHPLFRMLLEDAESEYGYNSQGPISLPCDVDLFYKVLAEMESRDDHHDGDEDGFMVRRSSPGCSLILCSPLHSHGYKGYKLLSPSRLLKINSF